MRARPPAAQAGTRASGTSPGAGVTPAAGPSLPQATSAPISRKLFSARKEFIVIATKTLRDNQVCASAVPAAARVPPHGLPRDARPGSRPSDRQCPLPPRGDLRQSPKTFLSYEMKTYFNKKCFRDHGAVQLPDGEP